MPLIAVAFLRRIERHAATFDIGGIFLDVGAIFFVPRDKSKILRVQHVVAAIEAFWALLCGGQQVPNRRDRTVVQIWPAQPDAVEMRHSVAGHMAGSAGSARFGRVIGIGLDFIQGHDSPHKRTIRRMTCRARALEHLFPRSDLVRLHAVFAIVGVWPGGRGFR